MPAVFLVLRVVFFIQNFSRGAGSERATALIANYLVRQGYDITVLSICGRNSSFFPIDDGVRLETLINADEVDNRREFGKVFSRLVRFFKNHDCDICIEVFSSLCLYTVPLKRLFNFKNITWEHYNFEYEAGMIRFGRRLALRYSDAFVVLTEMDKNRYIQAYPCAAQKLKAIYNASPYEIEAFEQQEARDDVVLAVGRLTRVKRFDRLLLAWGIVEGFNCEWRLNIVGEGEERESLEKLAAMLDLRNVYFLGEVEDMCSVYEQAGLLVSTSETEGLPMVMIEAQCFGMPIVSLDYYAGPQEIVRDGFDGILADGMTEDDQIEALAMGLLSLMSRNDIREEMVDHAYEGARRFDLDPIGQEWLKTLESLDAGTSLE